MTAHLDTIVQPFSMDIGFGDIVVPEPQELDYPLLLDNMPEVSINAYSLETVVAEKFQTMIDRALANSRMKDFFDVYSILSSESERVKVNEETLFEAIASVFSKPINEIANKRFCKVLQFQLICRDILLIFRECKQKLKCISV